MNNHDLPDDPACWPDDPFILLGVSRQVERRELRRAYARLVRRFKPEHFPVEFRRIRDAYEAADSFLQYQELYGDETPVDAAGQDGEPTVAGPLETVEKREPADIAAFSDGEKPTAADPAAAAWQLAIEGNYAEGYARLCEARQQHPGDASIYASLYWLLRLHPSLDVQCDRRQWLADGLAATDFDPRLAELYNREWQIEPEEAIRLRSRNLLECRGTLGHWARYVARCWEYAGLLERWDMIAQDLDLLRARVHNEDHRIWVQLLLVATEQFLWQNNSDAYNQLASACRGEIDEYSEEHWDLTVEMDRCEYLAELTAGCRRLGVDLQLQLDLSEAMHRLLHCSWVQPFDIVQPQLQSLLRPMVEDPRQALNTLDRIYQFHSAVLYQLNSLIEVMSRNRHDFNTDDASAEIVALTETFLSMIKRRDYEQTRPDLLFYCIGNRVAVDQLMATANKAELPMPNNQLAENLWRDLPLRSLTAACQAFWP